jgi:hypothetical protein
MAALADYYSIPGNNTVPTDPATIGITMSSGNSGVISGSINNIVVTVTDDDNRCPADYQGGDSRWSGGGVYEISMQ